MCLISYEPSTTRMPDGKESMTHLDNVSDTVVVAPSARHWLSAHTFRTYKFSKYASSHPTDYCVD